MTILDQGQTGSALTGAPISSVTKLDIKIPSRDEKYLPETSLEWLKDYGLESTTSQGLNLNFKQFLKPFIISKTSLPNRSNPSKIYSKTSIITYENYNLNISHKDLSKYKKNLQKTSKIIKNRLSWLSTNSRAVFSNLTSEKIFIVVDVSSENYIYLNFLREQFKYFVMEQLVNAEYFNVCCVSSDQFHVFHNDYWGIFMKKNFFF